MTWRKGTTTCCDVFESRLRDAGERGLSIIVVDNGGTPLFKLQSRGVAHRDIDTLRAGPCRDAAVLISLSTSIGIRFCPWCGYRLAKLLRRAPEHYRELIREHAPFEAI